MSIIKNNYKKIFLFLIPYIFYFHLGLSEESKIVNRKIAITMDGLAIDNQDYIIEIYRKFHVPGTFAINETINLKKNSEKEIYDYMKKYLKEGFIIMNHTANHRDANTETLEEFKKDVLDGEKILDRAIEDSKSNQSKYFRFPYLSRGKSYDDRIAINNFLIDRGYIVAPVSIDTIDWKFETKYLDAEKNKDQKSKEEIEKKYLEFTKAVIDRQEKWSEYLFERNPNHILLVHPSKITLNNLEKILQIFKDAGYEFISLKDALEDGIYKIDIITECKDDQECSGGSQLTLVSIVNNKSDWRKENRELFKFPNLSNSKSNS